MSRAQRLVPLAAAALLATIGAAAAATAHNSQAGAWGPTSHNCDATPYFPADTECFPNNLVNRPVEATYPRSERVPQRDLILPPGQR